MEWVRALQKSHELKTRGRQYLRRYGLANEAEAAQPLAKMEPGKATGLILNWLTLNPSDNGSLELRIKTDEEQMVYKGKIYFNRKAMSIRQVKQAPELIGKTLHQWDEQVSYDTLTMEAIIRSIQMADVTNDRQEAKALL